MITRHKKALCIFSLIALIVSMFVSVMLPKNAQAATQTFLYPKMLASDGKKLYIGTDDGLVIWDGKSFTSIEPPYIPSVRINYVNADSAGNVIIGTDNGAAYLFRQNRWRAITSSDNLPSPSVTAAASCKTQIFVGSSNGLAVYKKGTTAAPVIYQYPELPHNYITAVQCADTQAFVGTMSGIVRISGDYAYPISSIVANKMVVANQKLWVASSQGLFQFDMQGRLIKRWDVNNGLYSSNVTTLTVDRNNVVYAFDGQNIVRMSDMKKFPIGTPVYDLAYLNGVFYIATPDGLFSTYDFMDFVNVYAASSYVQSAFISGNHVIHIQDGFLFVDGKPASVTGVVKAYPGDWITAITSNQVFLVDPSSMKRYNVKSDAFLEIAPYSIQNAYYSASSGMLYLAGYGQLFSIHRVSGTYKKATLPFYSTKALWSDGKYVYMLSDRTAFIGDQWGNTVRNTTLSFYIRNVAPIKGGIYIATDQGVKYAPSLWSTFKNYSNLDVTKVYLPANSYQVFAATSFAFSRIGNTVVYFDWGNGLYALPDQVLSVDNVGGITFFISGKIYKSWKPSAMVDWVNLDGKEEAAKLQAVGILEGFSGKVYPTKPLTYEEIAVFYVRLKGWGISSRSTLAQADNWAKPYIATLEQRNIKLNVDYRKTAEKTVVSKWLPELSPLFKQSTINRQQAVTGLYNLLPF